MAVNVALYGSPKRWAMTERGRKRAVQDKTGFSVKASGIRVEGDSVVITVDETCAPIPRPLKGTIRLRPNTVSDTVYPLDGAKEHFWRPVAPAAPIEVHMDAPELSWQGTGYLDMNYGMRALEATFAHWDWMRVDLGGGNSAVLYETAVRDSANARLALLKKADGTTEMFDPPPLHDLPRTLWRVRRAAWSENGPPQLQRTLEDTPFYVRTELITTLFGERHSAIQESLSLARFKSPVVRMMLPFRMPRLGNL